MLCHSNNSLKCIVCIDLMMVQNNMSKFDCIFHKFWDSDNIWSDMYQSITFPISNLGMRPYNIKVQYLCLCMYNLMFNILQHITMLLNLKMEYLRGMRKCRTIQLENNLVYSLSNYYSSSCKVNIKSHKRNILIIQK